MSRKSIGGGLVAAALLGSVSAAHAQVTKVEVTPSPAILGQPATVTVTGGSAPCGAVQVNYGDGQASTYPISALPLVQTHVWNTVGNKTVVASGQGNCTGQATVTVGIVRSATKIGVNKGTQMYAMRIKSYFGLSQPRGLAAIAGENFGAQPGQVVAKLKTWNGATKPVSLIVKDWRPSLIEVTWPADIEGVRDQMDVVVEVTDATNTHKAGWNVFFRAETDYQLLSMSRVQVLTCGKDGNKNRCNDANPGSNGTCLIDPSIVKCDGSFGAMHYNCHGAIGDDTGTDAFQIKLANDWTIQKFIFLKNDHGGTVGNPVPSLPFGTAKWTPKVSWTVTPADTITYCTHVYVVGPKGVPY